VTLRLYLRDAQGTVLTEFATMQGDTLADGQGLANSLATIAPDDIRRALGGFRSEQPAGEVDRRAPITRRYGPMAVSVNAATTPVILAVGMYAGGPDVASQLIEAIETKRNQQLLAAADLQGLIAGLKMEQENRDILRRVLTADPILYEVTAVLYRRGQESGVPEAMYRGVTLVARGAAARDRSASGGMTRLSSIMDWKRVYDR
jgi:hypothetical protein